MFTIIQQYYNAKLADATQGGKRVLEIGCGPGTASLFLAKHGINVVVLISSR